MTVKQWLRASCATIAVFAAVGASAQTTTDAILTAPSATGAHTPSPVFGAGPTTTDALASQYASTGRNNTALTSAAKLALLQKNVKYVFVLFQENRSFDQHFGTFPGADGLFDAQGRLRAQLGSTQKIVNTDGTVGTISPFLIPRTIKNAAGATVQLNPEDTASVDHSHAGIVNGIHAVPVNTGNGILTLNDRYALNAEGLSTDANGNIVVRYTGAAPTTTPTLVKKQTAELVMSHLDCDTVPFLWQYANRFTLLDNFHATVIAPSTPNAIAIIAGQSGLTQWALHPSQASSNTSDPTVARGGGEPVFGDPSPLPGSNLDTSAVKPTFGINDTSPKTPAGNQTYASLPLTMMGRDIKTIIAADQNPAADLVDVQDDIRAIASQNHAQVAWGWYQEGYDHEPTDGAGPATSATYITHHNGPQYFGYIGDNTTEQKKLHGLQDFFTDIGANALPAAGGVFYVRGGYGNNDGLVPVVNSAAARAAFVGSDDHPAYSDAQIAEALLADEINAIAASPYWANSAIVITYDESDGLYDHAPIAVRALDPAGLPLEGAFRVPTIVISPFARAHVVDHEYAEHSSVIRFINALFNLIPLHFLPDEAKGQSLGMSNLNQQFVGAADDVTWGINDLSYAFDNSRLLGTLAPLPASYAMIDPTRAHTLPHDGGEGCKAVGITPTDYVNGVLQDPPPADFNPRPRNTPGTPSTDAVWPHDPVHGGGGRAGG